MCETAEHCARGTERVICVFKREGNRNEKTGDKREKERKQKRSEIM